MCTSPTHYTLWGRALLEKLLSQSENSSRFMKLEGSLQNSNSRSPFPILTQKNPAQTLSFHAFKAHVHGQLLHFSLPRCHLSSGIPTKALHALFSSPMRAAFPAHLMLFDQNTLMKYCKDYRSLNSSWCNFPQPPVTSSFLGTKYPPQHPILERPQHMVLP